MAPIERLARPLLIAVLVGLSIAWLIWAANGVTLSDSHAYRLAAQRLASGEGIYAPPPNQDEAFRYAPWFAAAWIPIAALPKALGDALWLALLVVASVLAVLPLARRATLSARLIALLGGTVLLWTAARGNVHPLVMLALIQGLDRRSGPLWVALAASLKAVPILFGLVYLARREWWRALGTLAIAAVLVAPMPLMGWKIDAVQAGASLSLYDQVSPVVWGIATVVAVALAFGVAWWRPRHAALAAAIAAIIALPRLLLYDLTYLLVGVATPTAGEPAVSPGSSPPRGERAEAQARP
jgi:hypothetical protein